MQLFGLPNVAQDVQKIRKDILKRNLTLCIVFAMYIAPEVIEWVTAVFEYYFSMLGMTDIYIFHGVYCVTK